MSNPFTNEEQPEKNPITFERIVMGVLIRLQEADTTKHNNIDASSAYQTIYRWHKKELNTHITTKVGRERLKERKIVSDQIKRQRDHYEHDKLFSAEYQAGMGDAALIAYDPDVHLEAQPQSEELL